MTQFRSQGVQGFQRLAAMAVSCGISFVAVVKSSDLRHQRDCPISGG